METGVFIIDLQIFKNQFGIVIVFISMPTFTTFPGGLRKQESIINYFKLFHYEKD